MKNYVYLSLVSLVVLFGSGMDAKSAHSPKVPLTISDVWLNDGTFVWLNGMPQPTTSPGPSFFFTESGSLLQGTNVIQDINLNDGIFHASHATVMTDSNEPPSVVSTLVATDSENYTFYSYSESTVTAHPDHANSMFDMVSWTTNGSNSEITLFADPSGYAGGSYMMLLQDGSQVFKADRNGLVSANTYSASSQVGITTNVTLLPGMVIQVTGGIITSVK